MEQKEREPASRRNSKQLKHGASLRDMKEEIHSTGAAAMDSVTSVHRVMFTGDLGALVGSNAAASQPSRLKGEVEEAIHGPYVTASVPLLHDVQLELDDGDAAVVLVLPQQVSTGARVAEPGEMLSKAFWGRTEFLSPEAQEIFDAGRRGAAAPMSERSYVCVVREEIVRVLADAGFRFGMRESIDGSEAFVLLSLPRDGAAIRRMAWTYSYRLPLKHTAYAHIGVSIMSNGWGEEVPAYMAYEEGLDEYLQEFSARDEVLVAKRRLDSLLDFHELARQGVVTKHFPAARYEDVVHLHRVWSQLWRLCLPPTFDNERFACKRFLLHPWTSPINPEVVECVRDYYGEEVAFFYIWLARFIHWLMPLALFGLLVLVIRKHPAWAPHISGRADERIRLAFAIVMVLWASLVNKLWARVAARWKQKWGLESGEVTVQTWSVTENYRPHMVAGRAAFSYACPVIYCLVFVLLVLLANQLMDSLHVNVPSWEPTLGICLFEGIWARLVPYVVDLQNHEMQARWNDTLIWFLAPVQLLITVAPFFYLMFIKKYSESHTVEIDSPQYDYILSSLTATFEASDAGCRMIAQNATVLLGFLAQQGFVRKQGGNRAKFYGCLPVECWLRHPEKRRAFDPTACNPASECDLEVRLKTDCLNRLESELFVFYVFHFSNMLAMVIWPIIVARFKMKKAIIRENAKVGTTTGRYSLLQFQAKCFDTARYEYWKWGGSFVQNFMEPAIVFLHLQCFSLIAPGLTAVAFVTLVLEYRLMAYRHNNVVCRNWPYASRGIGAWSLIFKCCSALAVFCIVCKVTLLDDEEKLFEYEELIADNMGLEMQSRDYKLANFIALQVLMFVIHAGVSMLIPDRPDDVERIENFNAVVKTKLMEQELEKKMRAQSARGAADAKASSDFDAVRMGLQTGLDADSGSSSSRSSSPSSSSPALCFPGLPCSSDREDSSVSEGSELGCLFSSVRRVRGVERTRANGHGAAS